MRRLLVVASVVGTCCAYQDALHVPADSLGRVKLLKAL